MLHENLLKFASFRYLKVATLLVLGSIVAYLWHTPRTIPNGGTWLGYTLGTIGAVLILWLMFYGLRKRAYRSRLGTVKGWLSAHVYLGLSLIVVATLHTGFQFGWNIHTLAYALMLGVIFSGMWGVYVYFRNPVLMSGMLDGKTVQQLGGSLREIDAQSRKIASTLSPDLQALVQRSSEAAIVGSLFGRFRAQVIGCPTRRAVGVLQQRAKAEGASKPLRDLLNLQFRRLSQLDEIRSFVKLKTWTDLWLLFHVPLSFALLATLTAHIVSVFFYW
ncbi:MAG: hypothetical protein QE509_17855 [Gammaproteobacteria bacterium]|nr:hypothetical protein [Gammaproteobacteria bacterium]